MRQAVPKTGLSTNFVISSPVLRILLSFFHACILDIYIFILYYSTGAGCIYMCCGRGRRDFSQRHCTCSNCHFALIPFCVAESPNVVAKDRMEHFARIEASSKKTKFKLFRSVEASIRNDYRLICRRPFPRDSNAPLHGIVEQVYNWNSLTKGRSVLGLYRPFSPAVPSRFDPLRSRPYYAYNGRVEKGQTTAVVTMGLEVSDVQSQVGSVRYSVAEQAKAQVIVVQVSSSLFLYLAL